MYFIIFFNDKEEKVFLKNIDVKHILSFNLFVNFFDYRTDINLNELNEIEIIIPENIENIKKNLNFEDIKNIIERLFNYGFYLKSIWDLEEKDLVEWVNCKDKKSFLENLPFGDNLLSLWETSRIEYMDEIGELEKKYYGDLEEKDQIDNLFIDIILADYFDSDLLLNRLLRLLSINGLQKND